MDYFFRKERDDIFRDRFAAPSPNLNAWSLKSHTIFQSKQMQKSLIIGGSTIICRTLGSSIAMHRVSGRPAWHKIIPETAIPDLLRQNNNSLESLVIKKLCRTHASSSSTSILISGCVENNFAASTRYPGHKLCVRLKTRKPFRNPFVSGVEKEYFLVGSLLDTDCNLINYFGSTDQEFNKLVNFFGSGIPRQRR